MDKLQLLVDVTGAFRPGILTALVGVSGAGKTTLMDVLSGRKTGGTIEGSIYISGYPKKQETFARVSGYCEQDDNHSPCLTVHESLLFSAWLRLSSHVDRRTQRVSPYYFMQTSLFWLMIGCCVSVIQLLIKLYSEFWFEICPPFKTFFRFPRMNFSARQGQGC